jgi:hypothetical protein
MICGSGALTGTGRLSARPFAQSTPPSERRGGSPGGGYRTFMRLKAEITAHPGWTDLEVA